MIRRRILVLTLVLVLVGLLGPAITYWLVSVDRLAVPAFNPIVASVFGFGTLLALMLFGRVVSDVMSARA